MPSFGDTPEGSKTSRLSAYVWKARGSKGAAEALGDALWESHGKKLFDAFRRCGWSAAMNNILQFGGPMGSFRERPSTAT